MSALSTGDSPENARWQAALIVHGACDHATVAQVQDHQEDYLSLSWH